MSHSTQTTGEGFRSGFVVISGLPNSGKSTLLNRLLGEKISITSKKPQTTRNRILGILHLENAQCLLLDTPGVHQAPGVLNTRLKDTALGSFEDGDVILLLADATVAIETHEPLVQALERQKKPVVLALNKIDLLTKEALLEVIARWSRRMTFTEVIPVSAVRGDQIPVLTQILKDLLPEGPPYFPEDSFTDVSERFVAGELIREKIFRLTGQEIPYSTAVTIDLFDENTGSDLVKIHATIHVEKESQKGILIGKNGAKIKQIGEEARKGIEDLLNCRVFLKLFVRVQKNWTKDTKSLEKFGY